MNITSPKNYYKILMGLLMTVGMLLLITVICLISFLVAASPKTPAEPKDTAAENGTGNDPDGTSAPVVNPDVGQTPLPETPDAGMAYQDKLIFVGDSLTAHLVNREVLTGGKMTKQVWRTENNMLNLNSEVTAAKIIYPQTGQSMTIAEAAGVAKPEIMIVTLGTDWGVSYLTEADFKSCYASLVRAIQAASPDTTVILQSIFPVTTDANLQNDKIDTCNGWVREIAAECGCPYLDTQSVLKGADNALKPEYCNSTDGIHLHKEAYEVILQYIRTHAYTE